MQTTQAIEATLGVSDMVLRSYVGDLTDSELLTRPGVGCNHIAWQLGHLIVSDCDLLESVCPGKGIALPAGFREHHSKENAASDDPSQFASKEEYLKLMDQTQAATRAALAGFTNEALDAESPEHFRGMFPTVGHIFVLIATHALMHVGQFVPVRRALGKPVVI
jgi:hypothetical protein